MIRASVENGIGVLELARAEKRNALTPVMLDELCAQALQLGRESKCILLCGDGPVFCAGFDLKLAAADETGDTMRTLLEGLSRAVEVLRGLDIPVVAAAHGAAIAGGCALLGGADVVVTDKAAKLGYPVVKIGVSPAVSGPFLAGRVGAGAARALMVDPGLIDGVHAGRIGLADFVVDDASEVRSRAMELADRLGGKPAHALRETKRWLLELEQRGWGANARDALDASLALVGGDEERAMLGAMWKKDQRK